MLRLASKIAHRSGVRLARPLHAVQFASSSTVGVEEHKEQQHGGTPPGRSSVGSAARLTALGGAIAGVSLLFHVEGSTTHAAAKEKAALSPDQWIPLKLKETEVISKNTKLYRFSLPEKDMKVGLSVASCLVTRAPIGKPGDDGKPAFVVRPYTPISDPEVRGHMDLIVKEYPDGKMSKHFAGLKPGQAVEFKGPIPKLPYKPNMKQQIGMVAGGTGITPMLQIIHEVLKNPADNTQISLVFANMSPEDILLKSKLDKLALAHPNFKVYYVVEKAGPGWQGGLGRVNEDILLKALPPPSDKNLILVCGPPGFMVAVSGDKAKDKSQGEVSGILKSLGYTADQVYKF